MSVAARQGSEITSLQAAWDEFRRKRGPWVIATAGLLALGARLALGPPSLADAAAALYILVAYPFGEWAIHVHLLHLPPFDFRGRRIELATARAHRAHHEDPRSLDLINFSPLEALAILVLAVPAAAALGAAALALVGSPLAAGPLVTMLLTGYLLVGAYEWTHFLIHTAHRPRHRYYRAIWRNHRLHHYKNEHYWHGITSTLGDRLFGTDPAQADVPRSPTARTLGREHVTRAQ
jgi:sterol desaturase/sphingolipid hydroxylase (fatty acid hydroxylase superfamily)